MILFLQKRIKSLTKELKLASLFFASTRSIFMANIQRVHYFADLPLLVSQITT
jgi:hypothetical protein